MLFAQYTYYIKCNNLHFVQNTPELRKHQVTCTCMYVCTCNICTYMKDHLYRTPQCMEERRTQKKKERNIHVHEYVSTSY